jgi:hypothetical protein
MMSWLPLLTNAAAPVTESSSHCTSGRICDFGLRRRRVGAAG